MTDALHKPGQLGRALTCVLFLSVGAMLAGGGVLWAGGLQLTGAAYDGISSTLTLFDAKYTRAKLLISALDGMAGVFPQWAPYLGTAGYTASLASARSFAHQFSPALLNLLNLGRIGSTVAASVAIFAGLLTTVALPLRSPRAAWAVAAFVWVLVILGWLLTGAGWMVQLVINDACLAASRMGPLPSARAAKFFSCRDDHGVAVNRSWRLLYVASDGLNAMMRNASAGPGSNTSGAGAEHFSAMGFKCLPSTLQPDGSFGPPPPGFCPPLRAPIDALNASATRFMYSVPSTASFVAAYADYKCPTNDTAACGRVGQFPLPLFGQFAAVDGAVASLVAGMPAMYGLSRCSDVADLLQQLAQSCGPARTASWWVFAGLLSASGGFLFALLGLRAAIRTWRGLRMAHFSSFHAHDGLVSAVVLEVDASRREPGRPGKSSSRKERIVALTTGRMSWTRGSSTEGQP